MEKITFTPNVPQQVALRFPDGKLTEGRFGDQMFYTTSTGKAMYLGLDVAQKLNLLGVQKNEPFWICKRWSGTKGDPMQWDLWRVQPGEQIPAPATGIEPTALEADMARQRQLQQPAPPQPAPPQMPQPVYPGAGRPGASVTAPAPAATAVTQPPSNNGKNSTNGSNGHAPNGNNGEQKPYAAAGIPTPPVKVGYDVALRRILRTTLAALKDAGEQWSDAARQDLVSTLMIQAARDGAVSWAPLTREVN